MAVGTAVGAAADAAAAMLGDGGTGGAELF